MNQAPNAPRVQSYRSRARAAFGISAVFVVPITALFIGGYINRRDATAKPRDVTIAALAVTIALLITGLVFRERAKKEPG